MKIRYVDASTGQYVHWFNKNSDWSNTLSDWYGELSISQNTSTDNDGIMKIGNDSYGFTGNHKLFIIDAFVATQAELNVGDVYYNTSPQIKQIRKKTGEGTFDTIPFVDGAIYQYDNELYIWNGTDLIPKTTTGKLPTSITTSVSSHYDANGSIYIGYLYLTYADKNGITTVQIQDTIQPISFEAFAFVLTSNNTIQAKSLADVLFSDIVLLRYTAEMVCIGGALYADYIEKNTKKVIDVIVKKPSVITTSDATYYNPDGSIYIHDLALALYGSDGFNIISIRNTIQPITGVFSYVLTNSGTVVPKASADILKTDLVLLRYTADLVVFGGALYADYVKKLLLKNPTTISTSPSSVYNADASIYIHDLFFTFSDGRTQTIQVRDTIEPLEAGSSFAYILETNGDVVAKSASAIQGGEIMLLRYNGSHRVFGGVLYADYILKQSEGDFLGKTLVIDGGSSMAAEGIPGGERFFDIMAVKLGVTVVNNAIAGSTVAKKSGDYESCFTSYSDWQDAITGGTLDTSKNYLVKDQSDKYYHIWSYSNGQWTETSDWAKAPLVDRIAALPADGEIILIDSGGNDWAHSWTPMGDDLSRDKTTFCGAMHLICQQLMAKYEGKIVIWCSRPAAWRYSDMSWAGAEFDMSTWNAQNPLGYSMQDYAEKQKMILREYGIEYFDLGGKLNFSQSNRWWCGDTPGGGIYVHPNAEAQPLIADALIKQIRTHR